MTELCFPAGGVLLSEKVARRFWSKVPLGAESDCWEWKSATNPAGYGLFSFLNKSRLANRISFCLANGALLDSIEGLCICHACDNPPCVNPAHLWLGTIGDNYRDAISKGIRTFPLAERCVRGHSNWKTSGGVRRCVECRKLEKVLWPRDRARANASDRARYWANVEERRAREREKQRRYREAAR